MSEERPTPRVKDLDRTRQILADWLTHALASDTLVEVSQLTLPEATGMSNVTLLFDLHWQKEGRVHRKSCVGRLHPDTDTPVFPEYDLAGQYRVMEALGRHTPVKTPPLLGLETDGSVLGSPFYIMERVPGRVPGDMPPYTMGGWMMEELGPAERRRHWLAGIGAMAEIHRQDPLALGLGEQLGEQSGPDPLAAQLDYWERYMEWGLGGIDCPSARQALTWLKANRPLDEPMGLCWGDARAGNLLFSDEGEVNAVLDWEMVSLGNPLQDIAWWNYMDRFFSEGLDCPRLEGLPSPEECLAVWQEQTRLPTDHYLYYQVFAGLRYTLILSRIMAATGQTDQVGEHLATGLMRTVLDEV